MTDLFLYVIIRLVVNDGLLINVLLILCLYVLCQSARFICWRSLAQWRWRDWPVLGVRQPGEPGDHGPTSIAVAGRHPLSNHCHGPRQLDILHPTCIGRVARHPWQRDIRKLPCTSYAFALFFITSAPAGSQGICRSVFLFTLLNVAFEFVHTCSFGCFCNAWLDGSKLGAWQIIITWIY